MEVYWCWLLMVSATTSDFGVVLFIFFQDSFKIKTLTIATSLLPLQNAVRLTEQYQIPHCCTVLYIFLTALCIFLTVLCIFQDPMRSKTLTIATSLLTLPMPTGVQNHTKSLFIPLFLVSFSFFFVSFSMFFVHFRTQWEVRLWR